MNAETTTVAADPFGRLIQRIAAARFLTLSVAFHLLIVILLGGLVLYREVEPLQDFVSGTGDGETFLAGDGDRPHAPVPQPEAATALSPQIPTAAPASEVIEALTTVQRNPAAFALPATAPSAGLPAAPSLARAGGTAGGLPGTRTVGGGGTGRGVPSRVQVFGVSGEGESILFMVDVSGSMVVGGKGSESYRNLEQEIVRAIRKLDERARFNVVTFAGEIASFAPELLPANSNNRQRAIRWLEKEGPYGRFRDRGNKHEGTRAAAAMETALAMKPDLIFFASDGAPSDARPDALFERFERQVADLGISPKVVSVCYKSTDGRPFMEELARRTGGSFIEIP